MQDKCSSWTMEILKNMSELDGLHKLNVVMAQFLFLLPLLTRKVTHTVLQSHTRLQNPTRRDALDQSILLSRPILMPTLSGVSVTSSVTNTADSFQIFQEI